MAFSDPFPKLILPPDSYALSITHPDGGLREATLTVSPGRSSVGEVFGWPDEQGTSTLRYPGPVQHFDRLEAQLREGHEALLLDVAIKPWFPGRAHLQAKMVVIGHGVAKSALTEGFKEASFQVSASHRIIGHQAVVETAFPMRADSPMVFTATLDPVIEREYTGSDVTLKSSYWLSFQTADAFQFYIRSAPMFDLAFSKPLPTSRILADYVLPLRDLHTLATLEEQHLTWMALDERLERSNGDTTTMHHQVYSADIHLDPFTPSRDATEDGRALFLLTDLPYSPLELLRRWRQMREEYRPFVAPLMQGLIEQMNPRARFLYLVQALEGLHTMLAGDGPVSVGEHRSRRKAVLQQVKDAHILGASDLKWLKRWLDSFGRYSLEERLKSLVGDVRGDIEGVVDVTLIPGVVPKRRNELSHGVGHHEAEVLLPEIRTMAAIGVAHILKLLEIPTTRLGYLFE